MELKIVDFNNYKEAIKIQKQIFPNEDGTINILASLDRNLFIKLTNLDYLDDHVKYYLAYEDEKIVGITGLYNYSSDTEVWIAWYGILSEYRNKGLGNKLLNKTFDLARELGFKIIRLYADKEDNKEAIKLYEKNGFVGKKYLEEELDYDCYIYSKPLYEGISYEWNPCVLGLKHQSELDQMSEDFTIDLVKLYDNLEH